MKRRSALQKIAWVTGGAVVLPYYCETAPELITYNRLPLTLPDRDLIDTLSNLILPEDTDGFPTLETRLDFVLTMVNDGLDKQQLADYMFGMQSFRTHVMTTYEKPFEELNEEEQLNCIGKVIDCGDEKSFFVSTIKGLSLRHFMTSENYMKNYLKFEFMPGRYNGCVPV